MKDLQKYFTDFTDTSISYQEIDAKKSWKSFSPPKTRVSLFFKNSPNEINNKEGGDNGCREGGLINFDDLSFKLRNAIHNIRFDNFEIESVTVYYHQFIRPKKDDRGGLKKFEFDITNHIDRVAYIQELGNYGYYLNPDFEVQIDIIDKFDDNIIDLFQDSLSDEFNLSRFEIPLVPKRWSGPDDNLYLTKPTSWTSFDGKIQATTSPDWNRQFLFNLKNDFGIKVSKFGWKMDYTTETLNHNTIRYTIKFKQQ
jgi:hypothetical protein